MSATQFFSPDYFKAREKFLASLLGRKLAHEEVLNPKTQGPNGEPLYADIVTLGNQDAKRHLLMVSATHGVEGFCGSACQTAFLSSGAPDHLPPDLAITFIHALNPHGFAWLRRVNEDNIDLNRNFIDFSKPLPENSGYGELRPALVPESLADETIKHAGRAISQFGCTHGFDRMQEAITRGQYEDADGLYYGGAAPTWSNDLLRRVIREKMSGASRTALIDFHTGLGSYGYGEIITEYETDDLAYLRAKSWYAGDLTSTIGGDSSSAALEGTTDIAFHQEMPDCVAVAVALEFGTSPSDEVFNATRADNWLHLHGDPMSDDGRHIKQLIRDAFYPDKDDWKDLVWQRAQEVIGLTIEGLMTP